MFNGTTAELSWGKARPLNQEIAFAISSGATRNLYLGNLPEGTTIETVTEKFKVFGPIESVRRNAQHN